MTALNKKEIIRFEHVNKKFPQSQNKALNDIQLSIEEGSL